MTPTATSLLDHLPLHAGDLEQRKELAGFTEADATRLAAAWHALEPIVDGLAADYVARLRATPGIGPQLAAFVSPAAMKRNVVRFVSQLFGGRYEGDYASTRLQLGFAHRRVGLEARFFLAALHRLHVELRRLIGSRLADPVEAARTAAALERLLLLDQSLIFDAYEHRLAAEARREHQRALSYAGRLEREVAARTAELERLSRTDPLTALHNRRALRAELDRELNRARRQSRPLSALYIDVDDFKRLNDREGHARGDEALVAVARALTDTLRTVDVAARLGGDEFCVLLPDTDRAHALIVAGRLADAVRARCPLTVSVGAATLEDGDAADPEALLRRADAEMYRNKRRAPPAPVPLRPTG